jgi:hypothetical protein
MVATKKSKTQPALKQSTLSFSSKRAHSSKLDEKKRVPIRKTGSAPIPVSVKAERVPAKRPRSPDPLEISSDSEDETETEKSTSERGRGTKTQEKALLTPPAAVEEIERERLNPKDRKWNKHYASVKETMGGLPAGESGSKTPHLAKTLHRLIIYSSWGETDKDT